jgi:hypothetical protein
MEDLKILEDNIKIKKQIKDKEIIYGEILPLISYKLGF